MTKPELTLKEQAQILEAAANALEKEYGLENVDAKKTAEDFQQSIYSPAYEKSNTERLKTLLAEGKYGELQKLCRELADKKFCAQDIYGYAHALHGYSELPLAKTNCKLRGLARGGYTKQVNKLYAEVAAEDQYTALMNAEAGYREGGFFDNDDSKLRILALTSDDGAQLLFAHPVFRQDLYVVKHDRPDPQVTHGLELLRLAREIRCDMKNYQLNYEQALEFRDKLAELKMKREGGAVQKFAHQFFFGHPYQEGPLQYIEDRLVLAEEIRKRDESKIKLGMK